jgi:hypothetical protein
MGAATSGNFILNCLQGKCHGRTKNQFFKISGSATAFGFGKCLWGLFPAGTGGLLSIY